MNTNFEEKYIRYSRGRLKDELMNACDFGDLEKTEFLLKNTELKKHNDIEDYFSNAVLKASKNGHVHIMKLLNSVLNEDEKKIVSPCNNTALVGACRDGKLEVIRYLLTSEDTRDSIDIHAGDDDAMDWACSMGHLEVVKYLTSSPEISNYLNIDESKNAFIVACANGKLDIIRYFIFDLNMKKAPYIQRFLDDNPVEEIKSMFATRDLQQSLSKELTVNQVADKKMKL